MSHGFDLTQATLPTGRAHVYTRRHKYFLAHPYTERSPQSGWAERLTGTGDQPATGLAGPRQGPACPARILPPTQETGMPVIPAKGATGVASAGGLKFEGGLKIRREPKVLC